MREETTGWRVKQRREQLDLYESGVLTSAELTQRIREREKEERAIADDLSRAQAQLAASRIDGTSEERIEQIKASGLEMLAMADESPHEVRRWLKQHFRVVAVNGEVVEVQLI